jgi:hypothetical protein
VAAVEVARAAPLMVAEMVKVDAEERANLRVTPNPLCMQSLMTRGLSFKETRLSTVLTITRLQCSKQEKFLKASNKIS